MEQLLTHPRQREIFIVPFPSSNQKGQKRRPALVLSNTLFNSSSDDVILCAITSNIQKNNYTVVINQSDLEEGFLPLESIIKTENIIYLEKLLLSKKVGTLRKETFEKVLTTLRQLF